MADTQHKTNDDSPEANHAHNLMKISSQLHREVEDSDGKPCSDYSEKKVKKVIFLGGAQLYQPKEIG